jgi:LmbE family N-acetylglucosaminyl deacetylase
MVRTPYRRLCLAVLQAMARHPDRRELERSAVVVSPHYDDETLGAGGTIIQKRKCGASVHLVFMTDGSRSHAAAMDGRRLSAIRRAEAVNAANALGVPESHVIFLEYAETRLMDHADAAVGRVAQILSQVQPEQVFVPSTLEPVLWSADHKVTTEIVFRALNQLEQRPEIVEYLVWFWYHWPWVPVRRGADVRRLMKLSLQGRFGLSAWTGLNTAVPVADVLPQKHIALDRYASQMTRLSTDRPWAVLSDVADGEFLERFFHSSEFFRQYRYARS